MKWKLGKKQQPVRADACDVEPIDEFEDASVASEEAEDFDVDDVPDEDVAFSDVDELDPTSISEVRVLTLENIYDRIETLSKSVSEILGLAPSICMVLLASYAWNDRLLAEKFIDGPESVADRAGIPIAALDMSSRGLETSTKGENDDFACLICCDTPKDAGGHLEAARLGCGHAVCKSCFREYLEVMIVDNRVVPIKCPADEKCSVIVTAADVQALVGPEQLRSYQNAWCKLFIDSRNSVVRACPTTDCPYFVESSLFDDVDGRRRDVSCICGAEFCIKCGLSSHGAVPCKIALLWAEMICDDDLTPLWLKANTKPCPKCRVSIEKNDGCSHMTCTKCKHQFCWLCNEDWSRHGYNTYNCAGTKNNNTKGADRTTKRQLKSFWHYSPRYSAKVLSQVYHQKCMSEITGTETTPSLSKQTINNLQRLSEPQKPQKTVLGPGTFARHLRTEEPLKPNEDELADIGELTATLESCILSAHRQLYKTSGSLAWAYAFLFFLAPTNHKDILEDNINILEKAVDQLAQLIAKPTLHPSVSKIAGLTSHIKRRTGILSEYAEQKHWSLEASDQLVSMLKSIIASNET